LVPFRSRAFFLAGLVSPVEDRAMKLRWMPDQPRRLLVLLLVLALVVVGNWWYRHWHPTETLRVEHYLIRSSATAAQTREIGKVMEALHEAYATLFAEFPPVRQPHAALQLNLFRNRAEFRRCNPGVGAAEAVYRRPFCCAYYSVVEANPYHWMLQQAVRQLNQEVTQLKAPQWIDQGLAEYLSTSRIQKGLLRPGELDPNTYPVWWLDEMELSGDLARDIANNEIIPLQVILSGRGGPDQKRQFNLYHLHWWSLCHFLLHYDGARYRPGFFKLIRDGGSLESFEKDIGPIDRVQTEWYRYLQDLKKSVKAPPLRRTGQTEGAPNAAPSSAGPSDPSVPRPSS
jgi:hypothetical protein